jgi:hypothetical protein
MELSRPEKSGFNIFNMTGLGPGTAEIRTSEITTSDGAVYNSARRPARNIVLTLRFLAEPTVEEVRQKSYKYFPIKRPLTLLVETDKRLAEITGYVESNDPVIFEKNEYTQISIICPNPDFFSAGSDGNNITVFYGVEPMFDFPFANESLSDYLLIMGEIRNEQEQLIYYSGDSEIGVTIYINAIGEASNIIIYNVGTRETMSINTNRLATMTGVTSPSGYGVLAGDQIIISTIRNAKSIRLLRDGIYTNILNCLEKKTSWFQLARGDNIFAFDAESGATNLEFRIENRTVYEGV